MMRIGSLFTGVAGLDRAVVEVFGGRVVWHSEVDEAREAAEVEELAQDLAESAGYSRPDNFAYQRARDLHAKGYRKQADDE